MKKIIALLLALVMMMALCGCSGKESIEDKLVIGEWASPNHTDIHGNVDNITMTFYEDGSATVISYDSIQQKNVSSAYSWKVSGDTIKMTLAGIFTIEFTYSEENGTERILAPQAEGYWFEHIVK